MKQHLIRRVVAVAVIAAGAVGVGGSSAGATTFVDSAYADTKATCAIPGLLGYTGAGFTFARFSTWVDGVGWMLGSWQWFQRNGSEDMVLTVAPVPARGRQFAILAEYAFISAGDGKVRMASEWVPMDGKGYWCRMP